MGLLGSILKIGGGIVGGLIGGPAGAKIGSSLGGIAGGLIEGGGSSAQAQAAATQAGAVQTAAARRAETVIGQQITGGQAQFDPFRAVDSVSPAFQLQRAFSGALGPEAQEEVFNQFQFDPGTEFLRKQGTENINRTAAAFGGLGGGNRLKRLSEFNQGLATQSLNNRIGQLQNVAQTEFAAAQGTSNIGVNLSNSLANAIITGGQGTAAGIIGAENARISGQTGINSILGQAGQTILSNIGGIFGPSAGTQGSLSPISGGGLAPGGGSIVNLGSINAPVGSNLFNVPSAGSFVGGFPTT